MGVGDGDESNGGAGPIDNRLATTSMWERTIFVFMSGGQVKTGVKTHRRPVVGHARSRPRRRPRVEPGPAFRHPVSSQPNFPHHPPPPVSPPPDTSLHLSSSQSTLLPPLFHHDPPSLPSLFFTTHPTSPPLVLACLRTYPNQRIQNVPECIRTQTCQSHSSIDNGPEGSTGGSSYPRRGFKRTVYEVTQHCVRTRGPPLSR